MILAAWFWFIAWSLWWLIAHLGAQGTTPVMALIGLLALPFLFWKRPRPSADVLAFAAFMAWCILTTFWSEGADPGLVTIDPENSNFAIEAPGLRLALTSLLCGYAYWALHHLKGKDYGRGLIAMRAGLIIQAVLMVGWVFFWSDLMNAVRNIGDEPGSALQNMIRIINITVLMIPLLAVSMPFAKLPLQIAIGVVAAIGLFILTERPGIEAMAAVLAMAAAGAMIVGATIFGRYIYRILGILTAIGVMAMPGFAYIATRLVSTETTSLGVSARIESWRYVLHKITERPILGWGVEASKGWDESRIITFPNGQLHDLRFVPGHPHNGALQIWAETGLIGAVLISAFAIFLGERLTRTCSPSRTVIAVGAACWGGTLVYAAVSYSVWNDAFWAAILFISSGVLILSRMHARKLEAQSW